MPRSWRSSRRASGRDIDRPRTDGPCDRSPAGSARSRPDLVSRDDDENLLFGIGLDDHNPRLATMCRLDHESFRSDAGPVSGGSLQHRAQLNLADATLLHAQLGVASEGYPPRPPFGPHPAIGLVSLGYHAATGAPGQRVGAVD